MIIKREFITIREILYEVVRTLKQSDKPIIEKWKDTLHCDKVFKKDGLLLFCKTVEEAQIISETKNK